MQRIKEKISVIIPVYNEEERIYSNLKEIKKTFDDFDCEYEIIICDDGSRDATLREIARFSSEFRGVPLAITHNRDNYGKGRALKKFSGTGCRMKSKAG